MNTKERVVRVTRLGMMLLFVGLAAVVPAANAAGALSVSAAERAQSSTPGGRTPPPVAAPSGPALQQGDRSERPKAFLLNSERQPRISISWPCSDGSLTTLSATREYASPKQASPIGKNLSAYVALGGNRGDLGLGTPGTIDVRVGFYTIDQSKPMFEHVAANALVTIEFRGVTFNQPARARPITTLQHLTFQGNDRVLGCAADPGLLATYNTMDPDEKLRDRMTKRNGRPGVLADHLASPHATIEFFSDAAGAVSMKATIPYALFKHADDPWLTANPGDFVEPMHFHIEFECEPEWMARQREQGTATDGKRLGNSTPGTAPPATPAPPAKAPPATNPPASPAKPKPEE